MRARWLGAGRFSRPRPAGHAGRAITMRHAAARVEIRQERFRFGDIASRA